MNVEIQSLHSLPSHNDLFVLSNRLNRSDINPTVSQAEIAPSLISEIMPLCLSLFKHICLFWRGQSEKP